MDKKRKIGIIGFGNMGSACGLALSASRSWQVFAYDIDPKISSKIKVIKFYKNLDDIFKNSNIILLAIKPQDIKAFLENNKNSFLIYRPLCISLAAGINTDYFQKYINKLRVIRTMPNLGAKVKAGITFISKGRYASSKDVNLAKEIFSMLGEVIVTKESMLDKATSISGSGPGYVYYFMNSLFESAIDLGFNKLEARKIVLQVFLGAVNLAKSCDYEFENLLNQVASAKGTTEAALNIFIKHQLSSKISEAVKAAYIRAKQIAKIYQ